ncbi:hypothetical protein Ddye_024077 [Dipteronia dyeriana]|uniref:Uncharacterized protein n=1 Tax=Dipteronia dyeriana TaxID=168575 RepID=A0AAD9WSM8_9ROSI|nr:hypothetical protein Ddye_024077 [Dipteronia dyeriana]
MGHGIMLVLAKGFVLESCRAQLPVACLQHTFTVGKNGAKDGLIDVGRARIQRSFVEVVNGSQMGLLENAGARTSPGLKNNLINPAPPSAMEVFEKSGYASSDGEFREGKDRDGEAVRCQSPIAVRIDKGYPTFQSFHRKGFEKKVKGGSDVRGLPPKAVDFQNSKEYPLYYQNTKLEIGRMEGQHDNLASDRETSSFSLESDIRG